jgi:diguanylate cyclase (GGDEF)-like protein/PAS domain S-box-containing protein
MKDGMECCGGINFEKIVNQSPVTSFVWLPSELEKPCFVSESIRSFGYSPEDFTSGRTRYLDLVHPDDRVSISFTPGPEPKIYRITDGKGEMRWVFHRICVLGKEADFPEEILWNISDVSSYKESDEELRKSEARLKAFLKTVPAILLVLDEEGRYIEVTGSEEAALPAKPSEMVGKSLREVLPSKNASELMAPLKRCIETGTPQYLTYDIDINGKKYFQEARISPLPEHFYGKRMVICVALDITSQKELEEEIQIQASHDPLGGSSNRTYFNRSFLFSLAEAQRTSSKLAFLMLDLDHFNTVNETIGRDMADLLLKGIGRRLQKACPQDAVLYRMEGVNYYIILPRPGNREEIAAVAKGLLETVQGASAGYSGSFALSATIGISVFPDNGGDAKSLLRAAETALSAAKTEGGNSFRFAK